MYTYMEDALDYLTDYASKHHIRIMWASFHLSHLREATLNIEAWS